MSDINALQTLKNQRGGVKPGAGRKPGYQGPNTIKKSALKVLKSIMEDPSASNEARAMAACKLIDEAKI